jgi:hypothetical protein
MLGPELIDPTTNKTFRHASMVDLLKDWTGGCSALPGNYDVIQVIIQSGVMDARNLQVLAHRLATETLDEAMLATVIHEFLRHRRVRLRLQRHALKYHRIPRRQAKADLKALEEETVEIMKKAGLNPWGES